jgi:cytoskeletal protein CcmA (bactofilin family)
MFVEGDTSLNGNVFAQSLIVADDLSLNGRLFVEEDASLNGNVFAQSLFVAEDLSLNGRLHVNNDVSLNSSVYIDVGLGIGIHNPVVSMDVSKNDAIRIPRGNILERPDTTGGESYHAGYIRYNTENSQFEGYGPGDSWGSLGGVVNVLQNTKITAANPNADSQNNELLFFTSDASAGAPIQRMIIQPDGSVGIGTNYVPSYDVDISGNVRITLQCEATSFNATSDGRLKENIQPIYDSLSRVIQLNGVDFCWSNDVNKQKHAGLIAQDVEKVIPEVVSTSTCEEIGGIGLKSIEYNGIIPYLIESIKTLNDRVKDLESQMN